MTFKNLPALYSETSLTRYMQEINKFPFLTEQEEHDLAVKWYEDGDLKAAHQLITSHLRLVAKISQSFAGYGLPVVDIISEGNLGLMHAVKKFNPYSGNRLATYAVWWVKAYIQQYILNSWSIVKIGASNAKKKLFYNLNKIKTRLLHSGNSTREGNIAAIAKELDVSSEEAAMMDQAMSQQTISLNSPNNSYDEGVEMIAEIADTTPNQETQLLENNELNHKKALLAKAISSLSEREQDVLKQRLLQEKPATLKELSSKYKISSERVRQIESMLIEKLRKEILQLAPNPA